MLARRPTFLNRSHHTKLLHSITIDSSHLPNKQIHKSHGDPIRIACLLRMLKQELEEAEVEVGVEVVGEVVEEQMQLVHRLLLSQKCHSKELPRWHLQNGLRITPNRPMATTILHIRIPQL